MHCCDHCCIVIFCHGEWAGYLSELCCYHCSNANPRSHSSHIGGSQQTLVIGGPAPAQLNQGTEFSVRLVRELTTKDKALHVGDRFDLETVDPVKLGSVTVFPSGTRAVGEITSVRNKGMWGKSGKFQARLLFLRLNDRNFKITGQFDDKGKGGGWGAGLTSAIVFLPAGFFMTGTSATVPAGAIIKA